MTEENSRVELSYVRARKLVKDWKRLRNDFGAKRCGSCPEKCELGRFFNELEKKVKS